MAFYSQGGKRFVTGALAGTQGKPREPMNPRETPHSVSARAPRANSFTLPGSQTTPDPIAPGLHLVATPIGNLGDITLRALATLAAADAVVAEDTRVSHNLLTHYGIEAPMIAYHEHNAAQMRPALLARLARGEALALISDAGTPLISDPGYKLVAEALAAGVAVTTAPGASSVLAALVVSGLPTDRFFFEGFLPPRSAARRARINELAAIPSTLVFFESPRRLAEMLADLATELGARPAAVARELTKFYESTRRGGLDELAALYGAEDAPKGEIVVIVGPPAAGAAIADEDLDHLLAEALASLSVKDAAASVAARTGAPRRQIYARALALAGARR
jgi:16S rRNA (cytidine1402-2'-O)-methyltransferase